jgi:acetolactate synthase I/II/III large subunit
VELVDALVQTLRDWDVRYVFGVSGANIEHLHDAVHRHGGARLTSVMARREDGAAFMADCRARVHRTLGVCCSTSGGGMMNLAVGLAESYADSVPVLAVVGQSPLAADGQGAFQDSSGIGRTVDAVGLLSAVTKQTLRITEPADFWTTVRTAVTTALTGRPGPVALLLPRDVATASVPPRPADWPADLAAVTAGRSDDLSGVDHLFDAIFQARCPVLLLGQGVRRSTNPGAVVRFAQQSHIPVATTMTARAEFPNDDPLYLGVVGMTGHPSAHEFVTRRADLVVAVGTGLSMMTRASLDLRPDRVALVNVDPAAVHLPAPPRLAVAADAGQVFRCLQARLDADPRHAAGPGEYRLRRFIPRLAAQTPPTTPDPRHEADDLLQSTALEILDAVLPPRGHTVFDAGNCAAAALHLTSTPAQATATVALGAGGMGYSIPAAIGAQLGSPPGTRTTVICGDGALLMNGLEIHTAVDLALPILFVVFNNQMHGMCVTRQQQFFDSRIECARYGPLDVTSLARGLGSADRLWTASAGTSAELRQHLESYGRLPRPVPGVLELRLHREQLPPYAALLPPQEPTYAVARRPPATREGTPQ